MADKIVGYVRVSTNKQEVGPEVQIAELQREAERQSWDLTIVREDAVSAATVSKRPLMLGVLDDLKAGKFEGLAVSKLDRLSRNMEDGSRLLGDAQRQGWRIICLDLGVDTATVMGAGMFHMALNFAEIERKFIGQRTKSAMGRLRTQKHVGRPRALPRDVVLRIVELRASGMTLIRVADTLNADGVATATGVGVWNVARVQAALTTLTARGEYLGT